MRLVEVVAIAAPREVVVALYADPRTWVRTYPSIHAVEIVRVAGSSTEVLVAHDEGRVRNVVTVSGPDRVHLHEDKRQYAAEFDLHVFDAGDGCVAAVTATVSIRGLRRMLSPLARGRARRMLRSGQLLPLRRAAEREAARRRGGRCDHAANT